jgi:hypothetical protein
MSKYLKKVRLLTPHAFRDLTGGAGIKARHIPCADLAIDGESAWMCTRSYDHTGRHAQGNGLFIQAVWL